MSGRRVSIDTKLMHRILLVASVAVVSAFTAFAVMVDRREAASVRSAIADNLDIAGDLAATGVGNWLSGRILLTAQAAEAIGADVSRVVPTLENPVLGREFLSTYLGREDGRFDIRPKAEMPAGYDPRKRPWYRDAVARGDVMLTAPYVDMATNKLVISSVVPVKAGGRVIGVTGGDFALEALIAMMREIDFNGMGRAFLVDDAGKVMVHPDAAMIDKDVREIFGTPGLSLAPQLSDATLAGKPVLVSFVAIKGLPAVKWHVAMAIDADQAFAPLRQFRILAVFATLIAAGLTIGILAWLLNRVVAGPIVEMTECMRAIAEGDLDRRVVGLERRDEIGAMAAAVEVFKRNALERHQLAGEREREAAARDARVQAVEELIGRFAGDIDTSLATVEASARQLTATAQEMNRTAEAGSVHSGSVAAASEQASANVKSVANASEALAESIGEISRRVVNSREVAERAQRAAKETDGTVQGLVATTQKINQIVGLISAIAGQTNLLALNATIEAARAGEAGRGFAVVATEVKSLAKQTADATEEISTQIAAMQSVSDAAVEAIRGIGGVIGEINAISADIAAAVERQGTSTQEIARNVGEAARGTQEVSSSVVSVMEGAHATGRSAGEVEGAARRLSVEAEQLQTKLDAFFAAIRAA